MRRRVARTLGWCIECSDWNTPVETSPSSMSSPTAWVVICSVVEFIISATSGQDCRTVAITEKSTGCASAMAAKMGCSGVTGVLNRDVTSGLWSVRKRNCRPSSRNLKCLAALKAASSSLSKVEYLVPAPDSFLE